MWVIVTRFGNLVRIACAWPWPGGVLSSIPIKPPSLSPCRFPPSSGFAVVPTERSVRAPKNGDHIPPVVLIKPRRPRFPIVSSFVATRSYILLVDLQCILFFLTISIYCNSPSYLERLFPRVCSVHRTLKELRITLLPWGYGAQRERAHCKLPRWVWDARGGLG